MMSQCLNRMEDAVQSKLLHFFEGTRIILGMKFTSFRYFFLNSANPILSLFSVAEELRKSEPILNKTLTYRIDSN